MKKKAENFEDGDHDFEGGDSDKSSQKIEEKQGLQPVQEESLASKSSNSLKSSHSGGTSDFFAKSEMLSNETHPL